MWPGDTKSDFIPGEFSIPPLISGEKNLYPPLIYGEKNLYPHLNFRGENRIPPKRLLIKEGKNPLI